jgi:hypothetical protein
MKSQVKNKIKIDVSGMFADGDQKVVEVEGDRPPSEEVNTDRYLPARIILLVGK